MRMTMSEQLESATKTGVVWRPIETAPQMRKVITFYRNALGKGRCVMACYYREHSLEMEDDYAEVGHYNEATGESFAPAGWYEEHDSEHPLMPLQEPPTHWMPLPQAPDVDGGHADPQELTKPANPDLASPPVLLRQELHALIERWRSEAGIEWSGGERFMRYCADELAALLRSLPQ